MRQRRLRGWCRRMSGVDELVISLAAKGLTTGEIAAHLADVYGADVSKDTISRITEAVVEELQAWQSRPLDQVYPVVFIDAIVVKIRDGQVANRPSTRSSASPSTGCAMCSGLGSVTAVSAPSVGIGSRARSATAASTASACSSATRRVRKFRRPRIRG